MTAETEHADGRVLTDRALVSDQAPTGLAPSGFDPSRVPELGNLMFGNSRGEHPVDRALQDEWCCLMEAIGFDGYGNSDCDEWAFENAVFRMQPYYWGDCDCGHDGAEHEWCEKHQHSADCYQTAYDRIRDQHGHGFGEGENAPANRLVRELCATHGLTYPQGSAVHCTCYRDAAWELWAASHDHAPSCPIVTPNFWHKPSGFKLDWYKYPLRDSYSNQPLTRELMRSMFADCAASLRDSDGSPEGRDAQRLDGEAATARAEGIANTEVDHAR